MQARREPSKHVGYSMQWATNKLTISPAHLRSARRTKKVRDRAKPPRLPCTSSNAEVSFSSAGQIQQYSRKQEAGETAESLITALYYPRRTNPILYRLKSRRPDSIVQTCALEIDRKVSLCG